MKLIFSDEMKCKLICTSNETRELSVTGENFIDGTPCSYDDSSDICVQVRDFLFVIICTYYKR